MIRPFYMTPLAPGDRPEHVLIPSLCLFALNALMLFFLSLVSFDQLTSGITFDSAAIFYSTLLFTGVTMVNLFLLVLGISNSTSSTGGGRREGSARKLFLTLECTASRCFLISSVASGAGGNTQKLLNCQTPVPFPGARHCLSDLPHAYICDGLTSICFAKG